VYDTRHHAQARRRGGKSHGAFEECKATAANRLLGPIELLGIESDFLSFFLDY
jgi:hypothetical protein